MFEVRKDEPGYAKLYDPQSKEKNRYGQAIELIPATEEPVSLKINHEDVIGPNPNRNKQHGFHFTADNCIGCHACESACSEKNDLPPHLAFRSVGYVEGGEFPNYTRMNISMACNHCDDPVCLKGCPTRAYTKHPEYGAVIQDPDICFGCGYCTWVCPYNAPQLDPVNGQVEKCNMCVDRLEVGLKPACVSACVGNALDFGVIENVPERRDEIATEIPGFPTPEITHPNIRFQLSKDMPEQVTRTDSMPIKYEKDSAGNYTSTVDKKHGLEKHWNIKRLSSRENPLVLFTLSVQAAFGIFTFLTLGSLFGVEAIENLTSHTLYLPTVLLVMGMTAFGLLMSITHVGKPWRFYRGFNNWRHSPVSREGLGVTVFMGFLGLHFLSLAPSHPWVSPWSPLSNDIASSMASAAPVLSVLALIGGSTGLYYMYRCYRIPARPFWNHWSTGTHFVGNALSLGAIVLGIIFVITSLLQDHSISMLCLSLAAFIFAGTLMESIGLYLQGKTLDTAQHEGAASHYIQLTTFGKTYKLRNTLLAVNLLLAIAMGAISHEGVQLLIFVMLIASTLCTAVIGRALFYVLVVPTTMPGAFFWKNKAFEEHARDIGMDHNPNSGVVPLSH